MTRRADWVGLLPKSDLLSLPAGTTRGGQIPVLPMSDQQSIRVGPIRVGQKVPDFTLPTFEPTTSQFGEFSSQANREAGKWTILFFYPADFTFV